MELIWWLQGQYSSFSDPNNGRVIKLNGLILLLNCLKLEH